MSVIDFVICVLAGLGMHQTASFTQKLPPGFEQLVGTAIGVEGTFVMLVWMLHKFGVPKKWIEIFIIVYQAVYLGVGIGVALGWMWDWAFGVNRRAKSEEKV